MIKLLIVKWSHKINMIKIGYYQGQILNINDYDPALHEGQVTCEEGHFLVAKRGDVRMHHFCHRSKEGDACASKSMTPWHFWWQARLLRQNTEFRFTKTEGGQKVLKIADTINVIKSDEPPWLKDTLSIVELQNSKMDLREMAFREKFYTRPDLLSEWGLPRCTAKLTWIFNLNDCDIQIDHIFGDVVCFKWIKGSKYMLAATAPHFFDFGKRDLIQVYHVHKPKVLETQFIGRLMSLERLDSIYFEGILNSPNRTHAELTPDQKRLNTNKLGEYQELTSDFKRQKVVEMAESFYFKTSGVKAKTSSKNQTKNKGQKKNYSKADIDNYLAQ